MSNVKTLLPLIMTACFAAPSFAQDQMAEPAQSLSEDPVAANFVAADLRMHQVASKCPSYLFRKNSPRNQIWRAPMKKSLSLRCSCIFRPGNCVRAKLSRNLRSVHSLHLYRNVTGETMNALKTENLELTLDDQIVQMSVNGPMSSETVKSTFDWIETVQSEAATNDNLQICVEMQANNFSDLAEASQQFRRVGEVLRRPLSRNPGVFGMDLRSRI
jgi:hypothetical protein